MYTNDHVEESGLVSMNHAVQHSMYSEPSVGLHVSQECTFIMCNMRPHPCDALCDKKSHLKHQILFLRV